MPDKETPASLRITVACRTGIEEVDAAPYGNPPLFGVHPFLGIDGPDPDYAWVITHIPTGLSLPTPDNRRMTQVQAQRIASRIVDEAWRTVTFNTARNPEVRPLVQAYRRIFLQEVDGD